MSNTTVPTYSHPLQHIEQDRFAIACHQAAQIMARPEYNGRLEKAVDFVLNGNVTLHEDGTATVKSGSHTYEIMGECTCQDSQNRSMYCKHFLAVQLLRRTYERLGEHSNANGHDPLETHPNTSQRAVWDCHQAPSSCTLKWAFNGIELLLTLRDATDDGLFSRIKRVLPKIEEKMELRRQQRQSQNADDGSATPLNDDPFCRYHGVPLKRYEKEGRIWNSHRAPDGTWCKGK